MAKKLVPLLILIVTTFTGMALGIGAMVSAQPSSVTSVPTTAQGSGQIAAKGSDEILVQDQVIGTNVSAASISKSFPRSHSAWKDDERERSGDDEESSD